MFLQAMPDAEGCDRPARSKHVVKALPSIGVVLAGGTAHRRILVNGAISSDFPLGSLASATVGFICHCNRDQIRNVLTLLPIDELKDIQEKGPFPTAIAVTTATPATCSIAGAHRSDPGSTVFR
jgi:molecular chaperone Hsp33